MLAKYAVVPLIASLTASILAAPVPLEDTLVVRNLYFILINDNI